MGKRVEGLEMEYDVFRLSFGIDRANRARFLVFFFMFQLCLVFCTVRILGVGCSGIVELFLSMYSSCSYRSMTEFKCLMVCVVRQ